MIHFFRPHRTPSSFPAACRSASPLSCVSCSTSENARFRDWPTVTPRTSSLSSGLKKSKLEIEYTQHLPEYFPLSIFFEAFEAHAVEGGLSFLDFFDDLMKLLLFASILEYGMVCLIDSLEFVWELVFVFF
jgi:hypothetical protein